MEVKGPFIVVCTLQGYSNTSEGDPTPAGNLRYHSLPTGYLDKGDARHRGRFELIVGKVRTCSRRATGPEEGPHNLFKSHNSNDTEGTTIVE